jgi:hypothetical protein
VIFFFKSCQVLILLHGAIVQVSMQGRKGERRAAQLSSAQLSSAHTWWASNVKLWGARRDFFFYRAKGMKGATVDLFVAHQFTSIDRSCAGREGVILAVVMLMAEEGKLGPGSWTRLGRRVVCLH